MLFGRYPGAAGGIDRDLSLREVCLDYQGVRDDAGPRGDDDGVLRAGDVAGGRPLGRVGPEARAAPGTRCGRLVEAENLSSL